MEFYNEMQGIARGILREFSQSTSETGSSQIRYIELNPITGRPRDNPGAPSETIHPIIGAVARGVEEQYIDGTQITASNGQLTFEVGDFEPKAKDYVALGNKRHKILKVVKLPAVGTPVAYVIIYES